MLVQHGERTVRRVVPGKATLALAPGNRLAIDTPGGGGYDAASASRARDGAASPKD